MKKRVWIIGGFIGIFTIMIGFFVLMFSQNMKTIRAIPLHEIELSNIEDGTYQGMYYFKDQIGATLDVTIVNHQITEIVVVDHVTGKEAKAEALLDDIVREQTIHVDVVAGATTSSHILKLAVLHALEEE